MATIVKLEDPLRPCPIPSASCIQPQRSPRCLYSAKAGRGLALHSTAIIFHVPSPLYKKVFATLPQCKGGGGNQQLNITPFRIKLCCTRSTDY